MRLLDCTLRDGANVVGNGFSRDFTISIIQSLLACGIKEIEFGNCRGLNAYQKLDSYAPLTDLQYLEAVSPFVTLGHLGMFQMAKCADRESILLAKEYGLSFLRVGNDAGEGHGSLHAVELVKNSGLFCRYSLMKAYVSTPAELSEEARELENAGVDCITIMDSAGTMLPEDAARYVAAVKERVSIPVGFHGHSNMGMSQANALVAVDAGADEIDCGLLGMARSAGNCSTELITAILQRRGALGHINLYRLLTALDEEVIPKVEKFLYHAPVRPLDLVLGISGCHSSFLPLFRRTSEEWGVDLYQLIIETSKIERKRAGAELIGQIADRLRADDALC